LDDCDAKDFVFRSGGDSRFVHLSTDRTELALSLVLHKVDERYARDLLLQDSCMSLQKNHVVESDDSLSSGGKNFHQI
jgi:hypothetical protein